MTKLKIFTAITADYNDISKMHFRLAAFCEDEAVHLISVQPVVTGPDLFVYVTYNDAVELSSWQDQQKKRQVADAEEMADHLIERYDNFIEEGYERAQQRTIDKIKENGGIPLGPVASVTGPNGEIIGHAVPKGPYEYIGEGMFRKIKEGGSE